MTSQVQLLQRYVHTHDSSLYSIDVNGFTDHKRKSEKMLVLENLTHRFRKPNVLDIKLGKILYDEQSASPEKVEKMKKAAQKTTSGELGLRLTGFQVKSSFDPFSLYLTSRVVTA